MIKENLRDNSTDAKCLTIAPAERSLLRHSFNTLISFQRVLKKTWGKRLNNLAQLLGTCIRWNYYFYVCEEKNLLLNPIEKLPRGSQPTIANPNMLNCSVLSFMPLYLVGWTCPLQPEINVKNNLLSSSITIKRNKTKNIDMFTSYLITSTMTDTKCTLYTHNEWSKNPALAVTNAKYCSLHPLQINLICKYSPNLLMKSEDDRLLSIMLLCVHCGLFLSIKQGLARG